MKLICSIVLAFVINDLLLSQDWANLNRYREANKTISEALGDRVVFMGNSITEGWNEHHPEFFENNPTFINRGIGGQTTPQMLLRFRADVINLNPKAVVILAGTNDIAGNTGPMTLDEIMDNIKGMHELAKANNIKVVVSSVLPAADYPWRPGLHPDKKIPALNKMIKAYCEQHEVTYLDYFSAMTTGNNGLKDELTYDGVHPDRNGYLVMEPLVLKAIKQALKI
ncbi:SGNH/GDSL hydrolase family protein [Spongiivirga sp. MCCC 1A20706]|uniref:SGNH/GDSL hydrolase family protein n=1 Tax=Spongiivirga sp. MCCC 1A20706 TaxID=3160963 RepID=UPI003977466E